MTTLSKPPVAASMPAAEDVPAASPAPAGRWSFDAPDAETVRRCSAEVREMAAEGMAFLPFSVEQYHAMIEAGILPEGEPYELIAGAIVRKIRNAQGESLMTVGDKHIWAVEGLIELRPQFAPHGCHLRTQQPIALSAKYEPEPDAAVVRGTRDDFRDRKPGPADVICVIEVADASLRHDRGRKLRAYADAGIPLYVIVNLIDRAVEVYADPQPGTGRYARATTFKSGQLIDLPTATEATVSALVDSLLP